MFSFVETSTHFLKTQRCDWARGKVLGGSSVINFQLYVRGNKRDFDGWEKRHGAKGWSYKDVLPYFKKFESYKGPNANSEYRGLKGGAAGYDSCNQNKASTSFLESWRGARIQGCRLQRQRPDW
ncbi:hypothetical protein MTO96_043968 [Rhipicephalus appendiculatus]